ncbi:ComF family protein [Aestuariivirga litoralis]|uniref:ComF family protein n=1 Tax=Aestuariivirga litoralis TaxID=2650924 RepID=UPI0018C4F076|nr:ComF family protein [Aestuariivirga litoralis]MBG1233549.1 ComF family protein [Aestuariivirga litoralis]
MSEDLAEKPGQFQFGAVKAVLKAAGRGFLDALLPPHCLGCGERVSHAASLCSACWQNLRLLDDPVCDRLGIPFPYDPGAGIVSVEALTNPPEWNRARAAVLFDDVAKEIVHAFKYGDRSEAGLFMARQMARAGASLITECDFIAPVPLHWARLWQRRFNQAGFLAQYLAKAAGKPYAPQLLSRVKHTSSQVGLDAEARGRNMRRAFKAAKSVTGKSILLIDDVRTTGATLSACTVALKSAGATRVDVLTFALVKQPFKPHIEEHTE